MSTDDLRPPIPAVPGLWRRKTKPLEVMHWDGSAGGATAVIDWILANGGTARYHDDPARLRIDLPRGTVDALPGDRIIKAEDGTFRPLDEPGFFSLLEPVGVLVSADVTSPASALAGRSGTATGSAEGNWRERAKRAEARLAAIAEHRNAACAALRIAETQARYPAGDEATAERYRAAREALEGTDGKEAGRG